MNQYPLWKYLLIVVLLIISVIYALPNLYGDEPVLQVIGSHKAKIDSATVAKVKQVFDTAAIKYTAVEIADGALLAHFSTIEDQLKAKDIITSALGEDYVVALNLMRAIPHWLKVINAKPMYMGLDLRGGLHLLIEVDMKTPQRQELESLKDKMSDTLREAVKKNKDVKPRSMSSDENAIEILFNNTEQRDRAVAVLQTQPEIINHVIFSEANKGGGAVLRATLTPAAIKEFQTNTVAQVITVIKKRLDDKYQGLLEPVIVRQGAYRIVVELPGVQNSAEVMEIISATASLEFRMEEDQYTLADAKAGRAFGARIYKFRDSDREVLLKNKVVVTGKDISNAFVGTDENNLPAVNVRLSGSGALKMGENTKLNLGKSMAVVFIEQKPHDVMKDGKQETVYQQVEEVISLATIRGIFSSQFQISGGSMDLAEANKLALLLRAGALAAPIKVVEQRTVGPALGQDNIQNGINSVLLGFVLVAAFMLFYYRGFGMLANIALSVNIVMIVAVLSMFQASLSLPGIAGIALTVGMSVDANVLIYERIREELGLGNTPQSSIAAGYERAFATIVDSHVTNLIAALVLFIFGTGPIKGFATTLTIGIITSMFTAVMGTRAIVNLFVGGRKIKSLSI
ncbi:MAG: protein translocase subunit SecD [Gammaproteobacteria bacterium]|nr:protein translocase subunit SecD [Gammaproteobacteria bacterium]